MKIIGANITGSFILNNQDVTNTLQSSSVWSGSVATQINSLNAASASLNTFTASAATTGSNTFNGNQIVSGSLTVTGSITTPGTLTAQTLVVQTITSSQDFVTGSTKFGSIISNTHQFTGSISVSGSVAVNDSNVILTNQTSSMSVATASFVANAQTASFVENAQTASFVTTAQTASFVTLAQTASFVTLAQTASFVANAQSASNAVNAATASFVTLAQTASFVTLAQTASFVTTAQTASFVTLAQTASFVTTAQTASFVANAQSASNAVTAQTASFANSFTVANTLTAQTLVVQTITSSVDFVTGSTQFGTLLSNTHVFSGSVTMNPGGLFVSSSGNIGIGTTNPSLATLQISGSDTGFRIQATSRAQIVLQTASGSWQIESPFSTSNVQSGSLGIIEGGVGTRLTIQRNTGNVGIGLTSPKNKFHVSGSIQVGFVDALNDAMVLSWAGASAYGKIQTYSSAHLALQPEGNFVGIGNTAPDQKLVIGEDSSSSNVGYIRLRGHDVYEGNIYKTSTYGIYLDTDSNARPIRIDGSAFITGITGFVGIGTVTPGYIFHIKSNANGGGMALERSAGAASTIIRFKNENSVDRAKILFGGTNEELAFYAGDGNTEHMRVASGGNVGIGVTNPSTYRLEVNGGIYASSGFFGNATTATRPAATATRSGNFSSGTANGTENVDISSYYLPYFGPIWFYFNVGYNGNGSISANWLGLADAHYWNNGTATIIWTDDGVSGGASMPSISVSVQGSTYQTRYLRVAFTATGGYAPNNWNWTFGAWNAFP